MCTALFCYCWRRTTTEGPLSLAFAALSFGVIVGVAGELSCEGKRSERAAARHAVARSATAAPGRKKKCPSFHRRAAAAAKRTTAAVRPSVRLRMLAPS